MHETPYFLDRLALGLDADARAIRRAYAREVKLIDQAREAARFQDLREAYEVALRWAAAQQRQQAAQREQEAVAQDAGAPAAPVTEALATEVLGSAARAAASSGERAAAPEQEAAAPRLDPRAVASAAIDQFIAARVALTTGRLADDVGVWRDALRQRLDSDDLINIEARAHFEGMIAQLLVQGWQAGHHTLLPAATQVFNWDGDPRRLRQFGQLGAHVNQAIDEAHQFETQDLKDYTVERDILARLRLSEVPDNTHLRRYMPRVERMLARFPAFMAVTVNPAPIAQWQARHRALRTTFEVDDSVAPTLTLGASGRGFFTRGRVLFMAIVLINVLRLGFNAVEPPVTKGFFPPLTTTSANVAKPPEQFAPPPAAPPSPQQLREIESRIHYKPKKAPTAPLKVDFMVYVSATGEVVALDPRGGSGDAAFDKAVFDAIWATKTFKATSLAYKLPLSYTYTPRKRPPAPAAP